MSARKSSHRTIFLIVSSGSPFALIASSLRSTSKNPVCPMARSLHPPMAHCGQRVRFGATWREEFFKVPIKFRNSPLHRCHPHRGYFEFVYHHTSPTGPKLKASVKGGLYSSSSSIGPYKPNLHGSNALRLRRSSLF